jgi:hypothetical protein
MPARTHQAPWHCHEAQWCPSSTRHDPFDSMIEEAKPEWPHPRRLCMSRSVAPSCNVWAMGGQQGTCKVESCPAVEVAAHKLAQVDAGGLLVEPVHQPARLVRHQDRLVLYSHALVRYARKIPAEVDRRLDVTISSPLQVVQLQLLPCLA